MDLRVLLLIVASCCAAGAGCQGETPASATSQPDGQLAADGSATPQRSAASAAATPLSSPPTTGTAIAPQTIWRALPKDGRTLAITFDDLHLEMPEDSVFDPGLLTPRVRQLDGRRVRIRGFIFPSILQQTGITRFPLVKNTECKFGPGGIAHHIILVDLQPGVSTSFTVRPIAVEGLFTVRPWTGPDGMTWTVYHMLGEYVR